MILPCDDVDIHSANVGLQRSYFYTLYKEFAMELYDLFDHCKSKAVALRLVAGIALVELFKNMTGCLFVHARTVVRNCGSEEASLRQ